MYGTVHSVTYPFVVVIFAVTAWLAYRFYRGRNENRAICLTAFRELMEVFKPDDQTFTNIGGCVGHHANFSFQDRRPLCEIDATITLLPRHAPFYMPISKMIMKSDRLFLTLYMRCPPPGEGHLIDAGYADSRGPDITNEYRLEREEIRWGSQPFYLYYERMKMRDRLLEFVAHHSDPGVIRHIAVVADQRKGFILMTPEEGKVAEQVKPLLEWFLEVFRN